MANLPPKLQEIVDDFALAGREEKIELLLQYSQSLAPLPERFKAARDSMEPVPECMTPVFIAGEKQDGGLVYHFDIPPQSPTVRGLAGILESGLNGSTAEEILSVPADFYLEMGLQDAITHQRLNGFTGILAHIKQIAVRQLEK